MLFRNKYKELTDSELLVEYKASENKKIIGEIYNRYAHLMLGLCLKYLKNETNAEDCVMHIFENLGKKLANHNISHFKSWIYMVTKNECLMLLRKNKPSLEITEEPEDIINNDIQLKELLEVKIDVLYKTIESLKEHHKNALKLFYLEKLSYEQVAAKLGISLNQVKSDVQNGKRNLRIKLMDNVVFKSTK